MYNLKILFLFAVCFAAGAKYVVRQPMYDSYAETAYSPPLHLDGHQDLNYHYETNDQYEFPIESYPENTENHINNVDDYLILEPDYRVGDEYSSYHSDNVENVLEYGLPNLYDSSKTPDKLDPKNGLGYNFEGDGFQSVNDDGGLDGSYTNHYSEHLEENVKYLENEPEVITYNSTTLSTDIEETLSVTSKIAIIQTHNTKAEVIDTPVLNSANKESSNNENLEEMLDGNSSGEGETDIAERKSITTNEKEPTFNSKTENNEIIKPSLPIANIVDTVVKSEEDKNLLTVGINEMFDAESRSFVFNPAANPREKFQECTTAKNESGNCRYVQHCLLPSVLSSVQNFMENVCVIEGRFIGVCCPDFPVATVLVNWPDGIKENISEPAKTPKDCGVGTNTRIVGGVDADRKAWPWMVALLNDKNVFYCGGSLINDRYVLTAAHCTFGIRQNRITARLGEYDIKESGDPHDDYRVIEIKRHGQYTRLTLRNDIALLKLEKKVKFNEFIKTICLPKLNTDHIGKTVVLVGWGHLHGGSGVSSQVLQQASFKVVSNDKCSKTHGVPVPPSLVCTAASEEDKGGCNGDSGGPLMFLSQNGTWEVIGAVSWGRRGCNTKFPTVYTRVNHFLEWIALHSS